MFIPYNKRGERIIYDGETLGYKCLDRGSRFDQLIDSRCATRVNTGGRYIFKKTRLFAHTVTHAMLRVSEKEASALL